MIICHLFVFEYFAVVFFLFIFAIIFLYFCDFFIKTWKYTADLRQFTEWNSETGSEEETAEVKMCFECNIIKLVSHHFYFHFK